MPIIPRSQRVICKVEENITITVLGTKDMSRMAENLPVFRSSASL